MARKDFPGNAVSYYFSDHLKTASVITDAVGTIKAESDYYPWGGELQFVNNDTNHYKFTGKERDGETGLDYFGARSYSSGLGRFITPDWSSVVVPVPYSDLRDPQSLNQYTYVRNIPTTKVDADGHCTIEGKQYGVWACITHAFGRWETDSEKSKRIEGERSSILSNARHADGSGLSAAERARIQRASQTQIDQYYQQLKSDAADRKN